MKAAQQLHRIPDRGAVNHHRRRGHQDSNQRIERHGGRQRERLPNHLLPLAFRKPREVWDVQRHRGPETDRAIQRGDEEFQKIRKAHEARWRREHGAKSSRRLVGPRQQQEAHRQQNRRADSLQKADVLDALENDGEIDKPECHEANRSAMADLGPAGCERRDQGVDGFPADPGLYAEPSAGNERA